MPSSEPLKMPERSWPKDAMGNELKKGTLVLLKIPEQSVTCRVVDVLQAGIMHGPDGAPVSLEGHVSFLMRITYAPDQNLPMALCLKEPEK